MRNYVPIITLFTAALSLLVIGCDSAVRNKHITLPSNGLSEIRVHNNNGSISVQNGSDTSQVVIDGTCNLRLSQRNTDDIPVFETDIRGDTLFVRGVGTGKGFESIKLSMSIPRGISVHLEQNNGNIAIDGHLGVTSVRLNSGCISGEIWTDNLEIDLANGTIELAIPGFDLQGYYLVRVGNGSLEVFLPETAKGADIRAWSENGPLVSDFGISATPSVAEFTVGNGPVEVRMIDN